MYLLSTVSQQVVPVLVFESQLEANANAKLYAEHIYQNKIISEHKLANESEPFYSEQNTNQINFMTEDIHDLKEYHSSNRSSPDSPNQNRQMTHYIDSHTYDSEMTHPTDQIPQNESDTRSNQNASHDQIDKMGEVIHITHSDEDEDIDVGDHVSVGGQSNQSGGHIQSQPIREQTQPQRQSVIVSLEDYARNQSYASPITSSYESSHESSYERQSNDVAMEPRVKIEPGSPNEKSTVDLYRIKTEPSEHFEPEIDQSLSPYTPANSLRPIEEHNQYRGNDLDQRDRQYACGFCHKVFRRKEEKKRHENSHLNIRSHKCKVCSKTFMRADHRNSHEKTHNKEKEFNCKICNKSFRRADEHKRHMTRQIHLRNVQRAKVAASKTGNSGTHSGMMHL
jgi:hypothetical protein